MRRGSFLVLALLTALTGTAEAQKKPRRPKKPKTERPKHEKTEERAPPPEPAPEPSPPEPPPTSAPKPPRAEEPASDHGPVAPARRADDWTSRPLLAAAYGGYGSENYRIGFGARVGYSIRDTFYVGAAFTYQLGVVIADVTYSGFYPAGEGGYDWHFSGFTMRPYAGLGVYVARTSSPKESETGGGWFTIYPGLSLDYQIGSTPAFIGLDSRVVFVLSGDGRAPSLAMFLAGGARF